MVAYAVFQIDVTDQVRYSEYAKHSPRIIARFGGRAIVRGGNPEVIEGRKIGNRVVIVEFPDRSAAHNFYHCDEYQQVMGLRRGAAEANGIIVDGLDPVTWAGFVADSQARRSVNT